MRFLLLSFFAEGSSPQVFSRLDEVKPLQDLGQDDAVEEAAQTHPNRILAGIGKPVVSSLFKQVTPQAARPEAIRWIA
jgi:hypothetical protein